MLEISSTWKNIINSPSNKLSFSLRTGDHPISDNSVNPNYPGGIVKSTAGSPRLNVKGSLVKIEDPLEPIQLLLIRDSG